MKILLLISQNEQTLEELKSLLGVDWMIWGVDSLEKAREIFSTIPADVGLAEMEALGPSESWVQKVGSLPKLYPWIGLFPVDTSPVETGQFAPLFFQTLSRPLSPEGLRWAVQTAGERQRESRRLYRSRAERGPLPPGGLPGVLRERSEMDAFSGLKRTDHGLLFSKMLTAGFDLDRLSNLFLDGLRESFGVNRVALLLLHEETLTFRVAAFRGLHPDLAGNIRLRVDEGTACWLAMRGRLLRKERAVEEQGDPLMETIAREMDILGCVLSIPMMVEGKLIGILCLDEKVTDVPYSAPEMERLFILTDHMAEAAGNILRHRRLLEEVGSMKSLERQWKKNGELELLNELIGRMAHELRNPLVAIRTFTQLLKDRYEDPELREFFYTTVSGEVDRLNQLVERLTTFIQPIDYHFEEGEIRQLLDETISEVFSVVQGRGIRVVKDYPREGYRVKVDRAQIRKAFAYLFQNALQSMTAGGTLTVRLVYFPDRVRLVVEDTGPGIPPEDLKRVFDPFYGASRGGTEMGLSLSQKIIEDHHGTVRVDSTLHQGTTLTVELPQADVFYGESHVRTKEHSGSG